MEDWLREPKFPFFPLTPKVENLLKLKEFWRISLIGCIYKMIGELLANRLKKVMHKVIFES